MTRKEQAKATRQKIIDESQKLIGEKGFLHTTVDDIAMACGIAKGTLYHYFESKEDIFSYIERGTYREIRQAVDSMNIPSAIEKLRQFILIWCDHVSKDNLNLSRDWHRLAVEFKLPNADGRIHLDDDIDNVRHYLQNGISSGELSSNMPVDAIAKDIVFSMYGASFYRCSTYTEFNIASWGKEFVKYVLDSHIDPYRITVEHTV